MGDSVPEKVTNVLNMTSIADSFGGAKAEIANRIDELNDPMFKVDREYAECSPPDITYFLTIDLGENHRFLRQIVEKYDASQKKFIARIDYVR